MNVELLPDERIDDLERNGYRIIQSKRLFCFGMDAVLLSYFAAEELSGKKDIKIIDLGTGTGIIPILLRARTSSRDLTGLEIQKESVDMARRSVSLNDLDDDIKIIEGDIVRASKIFGKASFDVVISNPPYKKSDDGLPNPNEAKAIARHEIKCTFEDLAREASALLKPGGKFFLVHRPERLAEIIDTLKENKLEPKKLRMVHSYIDSDATMFLLEASKGGNEFMKVLKPLVIYKDENVYTDEIHEIYGF